MRRSPCGPEGGPAGCVTTGIARVLRRMSWPEARPPGVHVHLRDGRGGRQERRGPYTASYLT